MCGLVLAACFHKKGLNYSDTLVFENLMLTSMLRGKDGAGVIYVGDKDTNLHTNGKPYVSWAKQGTDAVSFMKEKVYNNAREKFMDCRFLIGHTRWATRGVADTDNAHPFQVDHITMVHNGTMFNILGMEDFNKFPVDSLALATELSRRDAKEVCESIVGAAAMIWYDSKRNKLCVYRNGDRPLFALKYNGVCLYMASEFSMLNWIINREFKNNANYAEMLPAHKLFEWSHDDVKPRVTDIPQRVKVSYNHKGDCHFPKWAAPGYKLIKTDPDDTAADVTEDLEAKRLRKAWEAAEREMAEQANKELDKEPPEQKQLPVVVKDISDYVGLNEYFGIRKDKRIIFAPVKGAEDWRNSVKTKVRIEGRFEVGLDDPVFTSMLNNVRIYTLFTGNKPAEAVAMANADFLSGKVINITVNKKNRQDVRVYITAPEIVSEGVYGKALQAAKSAKNYPTH